MNNSIKNVSDFGRHYEIEINNGKRYIKTQSNDYNLYQIREWLQNCLNSTEECEGKFSLSKVLQNADVLNRMYIKDEEKSVKNRTEESKSPSRSHMKNYLPVPEYKDFIGRDNYLKVIDEYSKIVISAVSGTGKTSLARKYADKNKNEYIVRWILSDTQDKIKESYHEICKEIGKRPQDLLGKNSIEFVNEYIKEKNAKFFPSGSGSAFGMRQGWAPRSFTF